MDIGDLTHRQTEDLGNKMGGMSGIKRFLSGELVLVDRNITPSADSSQGLTNGGITFASALNAEAFLDDWSKFLRDVFGLGLPSRKKIILPETRSGFGWGIITPEGMTNERVLQSFVGICPIWRWTKENLDELTTSVRNADSTRVVWVRDRVEADEEHKNKSYNDLLNAGIGGVTILERLILDRWFYYKTGRHLDMSNVTRCDGSVYSDGGDVPSVCWRGGSGGLGVLGYNPVRCFGFLRSREAVS